MGFSVFTNILVEALSLSASSISAAYFIGTVCGGIFIPSVGKMFDHFGARALGTYVCLIMGLGLVYLSQVDRIANLVHNWIPMIPHSFIAFIAISIGFFWLRFTGQGALTMTSRSMLGKWFNHHRGMALSISGIVVSFSFSLAPKFLDLMIQTIGWRWTWALLGIALMSVIMLFVWLFFRDNPEECDLVMDGKTVTIKRVNKNRDLMIHHDFTRSEAIRTHSFWIFNLAMGLHSFSITGYTFHIVSIANEMGISRELILQAFIPSSIIGILLSMAGGIINPYVRLKYLLILLPLGGLIFALGPAFLLEQTRIMIIIGLGISGGVFGITSGLVWPRFFGRKHLGAISGINMATLVYSSASAPLVFSLCQNYIGTYQAVFKGLVIAYILFIIAALFADNPQRKLPSDMQKTS